MIIKRLWVNNYKVLENFNLVFPTDKLNVVSIFIGPNGSGKTSLLEVIAKIFSAFVLNDKSEFGFELNYLVRHEIHIDEGETTSANYFDVTLSADINNKIKISAKLHGTEEIKSRDEISNNTFLKKIGNSATPNLYKLIPDGIAIYYSGLSKAMLEIAEKHLSEYSRIKRKEKPSVPRIFYYHTPFHFNLLLLSLFSFQYSTNIENMLKEKLKITNLNKFIIKLKKPSWGKIKLGLKEGLFWGADGEVKNFLKQLFSLNPKIKNESNEGVEFVFNNSEMLYELVEMNSTEKAVFNLLDLAQYDEILDSIEIKLEKEINGKSRSIDSKKLSEGEQQLITIIGINELVLNKNSIALFDEPDTYLHPKWQRYLISDIVEYMEQSSNTTNSFIITTHSPQLLLNAKADKTFVKILDDGKIIEKTPNYYGRDISTVLFELMGVEERNKTIKEDLKKLFRLIEDEEIEEAQTEYERLVELLGEDDPQLLNAKTELKFLEDNETDS